MIVSRVLLSLRAYKTKVRKMKKIERIHFFNDDISVDESFSSDSIPDSEFQSNSTDGSDNDYSEIPFNPVADDVSFSSMCFKNPFFSKIFL